MHSDNQKAIQHDESLKPKNWFSVKHFDEKLKHIEKSGAINEEAVKVREEKEYFINEVQKIRDSKLPEYEQLEKTHYEQLYFFLSKAIKDVVEEQELNQNCITDFIDKEIDKKTREKEILVCTICGQENARRKLICDNCKQKEGIKQARAKKQQIDEVKRHPGSQEMVLGKEKWDKSEHIRFEHVKTNHKEKTDLVMGKPVFVNPNSNDSVALVLRQIGINSGIMKYNGQDRHWTFVCCDGRPHSLYHKILDECIICCYCQNSFMSRKLYREHHKINHANLIPSFAKEFDWLYLRIGLGHYEMNVIKSFFELNWTPYLESMCELLNFTTDNAKTFAKTCKDHHVAWQLLLVFHTTAMKEMVLPFVRKMILSKESPTPETYLTFYKEVLSNNPRWKNLHLQVFRFSQAIINLRMGVRRNNSDLVHSAKFHLKELFYGRSHPHYQNIELFDTLQYHFMPDDVRNVWDTNISFTVSGHPSKGQDMDFLLEEKNRAVKQFIPSGSIPSDDTWYSVCCNLDYIESLQAKFFLMAWSQKEK
ncbi:unnamed protein product [Mytilus coruscus]|uniref:C2H2-type domain-containing protein n=1 Tax=Mytilus coruscus TaxID=42192 RepID=A0A6J8C377_MYTCO|nr:unnamed protein product [Mytilus coruscus]